MHVERLSYSDLNRRTVVAIQGEIIKQGKRGPVSSSFHAKSDKEQIAAWVRELDRVLHIFTVRLVGPVWQKLIASL